jgi:hypothetical protein
MKKKPGAFFWVMIFGGMMLLISCNLPLLPDLMQENQEIPRKYSTVSAFLTETAQAATKAIAQNQTSADPTHTLALVSYTRTPSPQVTPSSMYKETNTANQAEISCDLAQAGKPIDITIPDDTRLQPGENFSKTWRLVNAGSCPWTPNYAVVWFSGDELGLGPAQAFNDPVPPGSSVDVTLDMIAPLAPGAYQSNWKLRNAQGKLFGIGPQGVAPFWVRIVVIPVNTSTPTLELPRATATPEILASGTFTLMINQTADLDSGLIDQPEGNDIGLKIISGNHALLTPEDGALLAYYGLTLPSMEDCRTMEMTNQPIGLDQIHEGVNLCYRTTAGLPGRASIAKVDPARHLLDLDFVTWVVP